MDYFIQNGGKKKRTKTESNSLKSKKSGGNFLGNLGDLKGKKGGACTLMPQDEIKRRSIATMMNQNKELFPSLLTEIQFREICVKKQKEYAEFEQEITKFRMSQFRMMREQDLNNRIEELKKTWANAANTDMKNKLKQFIEERPEINSNLFYVKFKTNILDNDSVLLCFTEQVTESLTNQPYNFRTTTNMYVRFNNIFETKTKLNSLLKKNNSRQKTETSSDMFERLLAQASSQGRATNR